MLESSTLIPNRVVSCSMNRWLRQRYALADDGGQNDYDKNLSNFIINGSLIKSFHICYVSAARFCKDENISLRWQSSLIPR